ncbi:hypothetical protein MBLNU230_g1405t1 [Neophaeotheca triangularis]
MSASLQPPNGSDLERTESFQFPAAHIGHLTEGQQGALTKFKDLSSSKGYYIPASGKTPASHDDETLLRYLRARKFNPQEAFAQFKETEDWRKENELDKLYETIDIEEYEQTRRLYPQWTGRRDKRGIPVYVYEVAGLNSKAIEAYSSSTSAAGMKTKSKVPVKMLRLFALYENLCRFVMPLCSAIPDRPHTETPISQSNNIVDISKVGLKQFWNLKAHMQDASQLATAHYPETLDRIFIIGAPSFFPTVWGWIKRWFDPITVNKIFILSNADMKQTLEQYIDPDNIPKKYGGKLDFKFGDLPVLEPSIENYLRWKAPQSGKEGHKTIPTGPIKWQYDNAGDLVAVAVGTEKGVPRNKVIASLHPEEGVSTLALNPGRNERAALQRTTTGQATHPPTPPESVTDRSPSDDFDAGAASTPQTGSTAPSTVASGAYAADSATTKTQDDAQGTTSPASAPAPASASSNTAPNAAVSAAAGSSVAAGSPGSYRPSGTSIPSHPSNPANTQQSAPDRPQAPGVSNVRAGTSSSRYEQQDHTHASGTMSDTTPYQRTDARGEKQAVIEPGTIGQAPKDHPTSFDTPEPSQAPSQPSYLDQAKSLAGGALETAKAVPGMAMNAVGYGDGGAAQREEEERKEREQREEEEKQQDPRVEEMDPRNVEEFLRGKTGSRAESEGVGQVSNTKEAQKQREQQQQ